jgi:catechol-2,3-dioxygenase
VIGHPEKTVIDCPDPRALAQFYCQVLGMKINEHFDGCVVIGEPGRQQLAFQLAAEWIPATRPAEQSRTPVATRPHGGLVG